MDRSGDSQTSSKSVAVIGCGGNIGSHFVGHVGRMAEVGRLMLIDMDDYEERNLLSQAITRRDIGKPKAVVQKRRVLGVNPGLEVVAIVDAVQNVPLGWLRADVIVACLDSKEARRVVNEAAWHAGGVPWIDAGVEPTGMLARVNVYDPRAADSPCLECAWDSRDYETLDQVHPCDGEAGGPAPTNGSASLGALAASLEAIECEKLLSGQSDGAAVGREVLIDAAHHKHYVTTYTRNNRCRFDHQVWKIQKAGGLPGDLTIGQALDLGRTAGGEGSGVLRVQGAAFVRRLVCGSGCHQEKSFLRLRHRLTVKQRTCRRCGGEMVAGGFDLLDKLDPARLPAAWLGRSLQAVGFRSGDIFTVSGPAGDAHFELG